MGWVLKKFQVGRYKFQVGEKFQVCRYKFQVGGKTWKCILIRVVTGTKPIKTRRVLGWKS